MELMTVVAVIAMIAAIAVPAWLEMQWRTKRVELDQNTHAIMISEEAYHASFDVYLSIPTWYPTGVPGKKRKVWPTGTLFDRIGYRPDGTVYGQYRTNTAGVCTDLDIDGRQNLDALAGTQAYGCCIGEQHPFAHFVDGRCGYQYGLDTW
jgi:type II secretory pathway pseudopilin PulG